MNDHPPLASFRGTVVDGRLKLDERQKFAQLLKKLDGQPIALSLKKFRRGRSNSANRYYWGICIALLADFCGYEPEEMHDALKMKFLLRHEDGPLVSIASTTTLDTAEFHEYVEQVRRLAAELGCYIPDPGEC